MEIYVDADACPVKDEVVRVAERYGLTVQMVSNQWMRLPSSRFIRQIIVAEGADKADDWIAEKVQQDDLVVTSDIPLAGRCVKAGASVLGPTGRLFTDENIGQAIATRDL